MRVFVTGATGFIGSAVVKELTQMGHQVLGLARTEASARSLRAAGAEPHAGALDDPESLRKGAAAADGVIHLAFIHGPGDFRPATRFRLILGGLPTGILPRFLAAIMQTERRAIDALGLALEGSGRPLVLTFGTMGLTPGRLATEVDGPDPRSAGGPRAALEAAMQAWASRGVRACAIRLPPSVHGDGDKGLVPRLIGIARKKRCSAYVDNGLNHWGAVHRLDAARLFRLVLEKGEAGLCYHGVAEEGVAFRDIAEVIGRRLGVPVRSLPAKRAGSQFSFLGPFVVADNPASSDLTRQRLGWEPTQIGLLSDIDRPGYFAR